MSETTFQDTPLYAWLRANAWFLLAGVAIVAGIVTYRNFNATLGAKSREKSWNAFGALADAAPEGPGLSDRLAQAKADPRIHPWVVMESTRRAAETGDQAALALLRPELQALAADDSIRVATPGGHQGMAAFLLQQIDAKTATPLPAEFNSPVPQGRKIEIVVSTGGTDTYTLVASLYEELSPAGSAALLKWIEAGRLNGQSARPMGGTGLSLSLLKEEPVEGSEPPPALMVERTYGLFHEEGMICLTQIPGQFGVQDPNTVQVLLMDSFGLDGTSTVVAKVVEGLEPLKAALTTTDATATVSIVSARAL